MTGPTGLSTVAASGAAAALSGRARAAFDFLKRTDRLDQALAKAFPLQDGWLAPVCDLHRDDHRLIDALGRWRTAHMDAHPTQFPVTPEGTRRWLSEAVLDDPERLLLLACDRHGHPIGQFGFTVAHDPEVADLLGTDALLEFGYLIRGEPGVPGLMAEALRTAMLWARRTLAPGAIFSLTFADNHRALAFQSRLGAVARESIALERHVAGDRIEYRRHDAATRADGREPDRRYTLLEWRDPGDPDPQDAAISVAGPSIGARETAYTLDAVRTGWNERRSEYHDRFAAAFAEVAGVRHALPTSSCTGAMHLALLALGVGPGDEVIVPDLTWVATANAVALAGATPVFADIEEETWCLDPRSLRERITERTRAVIPVHLYGYPARIDEIRSVADAHGLRVLEDAAPSVGAAVAGRPVGSWGDLAAFSFQGAKLLVSGEGGMLVTDDDGLHERARHLWDQARTGEHPFFCDEVTPKYKMSNLQAALGLGQLERLEEFVEAKSRIHRWYCEELDGLDAVRVHRGAADSTSTHWMTSIIVGESAGVTRDALAAALRRAGIDTRPTFPPLSTLPMWRDAVDHPVAAAVSACGLNLPSGVNLRRQQVGRVATAIRRIVSGR